MKRIAVVGLAAGLLGLCGCIPGMNLPGVGPSAAQQEVDGLKNAELPYMTMFHDSPAVGQFAIRKDAAGNETTCCIVGGKAGAWEVEERRPCYSDKKLGIVILRVVDDKGLVSKACAAELKKADKLPVGVALKVGKKPEAGKATGEAPKSTQEKGPEVAGLGTTKVIVEVQGKPAASYMAKGAFFGQAMETPNPLGGLVKSEYDGKVAIELVKQGVDAELCKPTVTMP